jgi:hypothetical protein
MHALPIRGSGNEEMQTTTEFWTALTMVNLLGLIYSIHLLLRANSVDENLFATCVLVGSLFLIWSGAPNGI